MTSALHIGRCRLAESDVLTSHFKTMALVTIPENSPLPAVSINRVFERDTDEGESSTHIVGLVFTVIASTPEQMEELGDILVDEIDGSSFDHSDLVGILFNKFGSDVTGYDQQRKTFVRSIEFAMEW